MNPTTTKKRPKETRGSGKDNVACFKIGQRVLWHDEPGAIHSYEVKGYKYPIGYNVHLDSDSPVDKHRLPRVINSAAGEIEPLSGKYHQIHIPIPIDGRPKNLRPHNRLLLITPRMISLVKEVNEHWSRNIR